jgi:hypothetical protein
MFLGTFMVGYKVKAIGEAFDKIEALVINCPTEIMGLGKVEVVNGSVRVTDIIIVDQEATSAHVEFDKDKLMDFFLNSGSLP